MKGSWYRGKRGNDSWNPSLLRGDVAGLRQPRSYSGHPVEHAQNAENDPHETGDPAGCGQGMLDDQRRVLVPGRAEDE